MLGYKPNQAIWTRVNHAILGENAAEVLVTVLSGLCALLKEGGICASENEARAHLAAVLLSPDTAPAPGSLLPLLQAELLRLGADKGKWIT